MTNRQTEVITAVVDALWQAESVLFITGAGVSAESGIPTYRGMGGLYNVGTTDEGFPIEEILSSHMLRANPALCWKYLAQIGSAVQGAQHNRAHEVIAEMESQFDRLWVLTQNIDGFHRAAGSKNLIEVHGNMHSLSCMGCGHKVLVDEFHTLEIPPRCPRCPALLRPDVVLFGELIDGPGIENLHTELDRGFDIVFSVGTTSLFPYIQAPLYMAQASGKTTVEINLSQTDVSPMVNYRIQAPAAETLQAIWSEYVARKSRSK